MGGMKIKQLGQSRAGARRSVPEDCLVGHEASVTTGASSLTS